MVEIQKELRDIVGPRPPEADELARVKAKNTLSLPGRWETLNAVMADVSKVVRFGFPEDHWNTYPARVRDLGLGQVAEAARSTVHADKAIWVVVGDRKAIEPKIRELGLGEVIAIDADGNPAGNAAERSE
jgi:zinc protease